MATFTKENLMYFLDNHARYKALFLLLLRADEPKTSEYLAEELHVTSRTIKNDLKNMKQTLQDTGISLCSKRGTGYYLAFEEEALLSEIKALFQLYQPSKLNTDKDLRVSYLAKRLLTSKVPLKIEDLLAELYLSSQEALTAELKEVENLLSKYQLKLMRKAHHGIWVEGEAFGRMLCMVRIYKYFHDGSQTPFAVADFDQQFQCDEESYQKMREITFSTLATSKIVFSDLYVERFVLFLIFFRNQVLQQTLPTLTFPTIDFAFEQTQEYAFVYELTHKLRTQLTGFDFPNDVLQFFTYLSVMSTDLYRFSDCTEERYGTLVGLAEETRNWILSLFSADLNSNFFDDFTTMKDLLKIMIPISLKVKLSISDDIDLGIHDYEKGMMKRPVIYYFIQKLTVSFAEHYHYTFSIREQYLIFGVILGTINRIKLEQKKLKLAIIALDGRLSTQQLKFNLQAYFSEYIEKIETKVLYELEVMENPDYDYYLCIEYGKNLNIHYQPIYFADETLSESEHVSSLKNIFLTAYDYDERLPKLDVIEIEEGFAFKEFPIQQYLNQASNNYHHLRVGEKNEVSVYFSLNHESEKISIYHYSREEYLSAQSEKYVIVADLNINGDFKKMKMFLTLIDKIAEDANKLIFQQTDKKNSYARFFI
ncbi:BglG family transcription antiterminator [Isobaculum melis]|uniref:Lichenan operon transcriptional antiterminator n=1 Tax=Isobaculum melis TaxID=142588 RepID=A0A1H9SWT0_9LACT|nr:HTH domain-containing protein [Isobaculum melis]SER88849.1 lichenan operon transcriptional antiterminator [Isobaculum melis]